MANALAGVEGGAIQVQGTINGYGERTGNCNLVPIIGNLFKSRDARETRRTLFVFLRPTILRDRADIQAASANRLNRLRQADGIATPKTILNETEVRQLPLEIQGLY